ncbi:outer membrane protein assembly factor BamE [Yoonia sp.]|uniref:outer membrane protein assembly factor BamE n=1 Tax=Yoonia sp. TaxID=2212373 RepID=UPI0019FA929F|nr:outer membrane protein assembly factor BamE [Yoonia sp.]MBE0412852.1 outer membrane protein assembly factor BamE [Yoonia sp.]
MSRHTGKPVITLRTVAMLAVLGLAGACAPIERFHGFAPSAEDQAAVQVGQATREAVIARFGPPTSVGLLGNSDYYYVSSTFRHFGAFAPQETDRQVTVVSFDSNAVVRNITRYTLQDGQVVVLDRRVTEDGINDVTFIGQLLGAFGRVDAGALLGEEPR